jgi:hypothetical protein
MSKLHNDFVMAVLKGKYGIDYDPAKPPRGIDREAVRSLASWWMEDGPQDATPETCQKFYEWYRRTYVTRGGLMIEREDTVLKYWPAFVETIAIGQPRPAGLNLSVTTTALDLTRHYANTQPVSRLMTQEEIDAFYAQVAQQKAERAEDEKGRPMRFSRHDNRKAAAR